MVVAHGPDVQQGVDALQRGGVLVAAQQAQRAGVREPAQQGRLVVGAERLPPQDEELGVDVGRFLVAAEEAESDAEVVEAGLGAGASGPSRTS
ncbi:hypothetical protein N7U49_36320 [Streptomyces sp. AD2-2]|nr:hypothetical protein N7U49_36320 [Streptomyces sp. AD2-2]